MFSSKIRTQFILALTAIMLIGVSCMRNLEDSLSELERVKRIKFNPELALPLINSSLSLNDLVKRVNSDLIYEDDNRLLHVVYKGDIVTVEAQDFVEIDDQVTELTITLNQTQIDQVMNNGNTAMVLNGVVNYDISNVEIDSMLTKLCRSILSISSDMQHDISLRVVFPDVKRNGNELELNINAPYQSTLPVDAAVGQDLKGYLFDMTQTAQGHSQIKLQIELVISNNNNNPLSTSDEIRFKSGFYFNEFETLWGFIDKKDISPRPDTLSINLFNSSDNGTFTISDPRIKVYMRNSFGIPVEAKINELYGYIPSQGNVSITGIPNPLVIPTPTEAELGQTKVDSFELNSSNSNFATIINNRPHRFGYDFEVLVNPSGSTTERNFVMDTSRLEFGVDIDVPLDGTAKDFGLEQEQEFEMDIESIDQLDYAIIRVAFDNGFPMEFAFQVVFMDSLGTRLDSLVDQEHLIIISGEVNAAGEVISTGTSVHDFTINQERLDNIRKAKKVLLSAKVTTPSYQGNQVPVKFYSHHEIGFRMGVQLKAKIDEQL